MNSHRVTTGSLAAYSIPLSERDMSSLVTYPFKSDIPDDWDDASHFHQVTELPEKVRTFITSLNDLPQNEQWDEKSALTAFQRIFPNHEIVVCGSLRDFEYSVKKESLPVQLEGGDVIKRARHVMMKIPVIENCYFDFIRGAPKSRIPYYLIDSWIQELSRATYRLNASNFNAYQAYLFGEIVFPLFTSLYHSEEQMKNYHPEEKILWSAFEAYKAGVGFYFCSDETVFLLPFPRIRLDNREWLHSEQDAAIRWLNGTEEYYLHGEEVGKKLWKKAVSRTLSFRDILKVENIECRAVLMRYSEPDSFLAEMGAELLDTYMKYRQDGTEISYALYRVGQGRFTDEDSYFMLYDDRSPTGRRYLSGVPPFQTVPEAMSWKVSNERHSISPEQWKAARPMIEET